MLLSIYSIHVSTNYTNAGCESVSESNLAKS